MNKTELISAIAEKTGSSKKDTGVMVEALTDAITDAIKAGEKVTLVGFGTFEARERAARMGHNPQTGEQIEIGACRVPKFKAGKALKDAVNS